MKTFGAAIVENFIKMAFPSLCTLQQSQTISSATCHMTTTLLSL